MRAAKIAGCLYLLGVLCACVCLLTQSSFALRENYLLKQGGDGQSGYIEVKGGKLFYESEGEGETIVMAHDGILHRVTWDAQFDALAKEYKVVRYDRRGYGDSSKAEAAYSDIEDLEQLFEQLKIQRAVVMGMSAGGRLSIDFTLANPGKVTKLILIGAIVRGFDYTDHFLNRGGYLTEEDIVSTEVLIRFFTQKDPYTVWHKNTDAKEKLARLLEEYPQNVDMQKYSFLQSPKRSALDALHEIKIPALIVVGEYDIPDVHAHAGAIEAGISGAQRVIVKDAAHHVPTEQPEVLNGLILKFIKRK